MTTFGTERVDLHRYARCMSGGFEGIARLLSATGEVIADSVLAVLHKTSLDAPSYVHRAHWYGEVSLEGTDLMELLRDDPWCQLDLGNGTVARARVNSWDLGGARAQLVGDGPPPF